MTSQARTAAFLRRLVRHIERGLEAGHIVAGALEAAAAYLNGEGTYELYVMGHPYEEPTTFGGEHGPN